ncbi:hypothetical protein LMG31506_06218 [Cupriavidus yeoncheonensis]|uniref:Uncharacterized protein n=1 Tax=Cupriavidus yeoncheonensis TaxID=1462994 RepID=A0A916J0R7_9BURK|nr:hypothetical protein LMG31506_06218 [Cupriavidus yeoncheonensis]
MPFRDGGPAYPVTFPRYTTELPAPLIGGPGRVHSIFLSLGQEVTRRLRRRNRGACQERRPTPNASPPPATPAKQGRMPRAKTHPQRKPPRRLRRRNKGACQERRPTPNASPPPATPAKQRRMPRAKTHPQHKPPAGYAGETAAHAKHETPTNTKAPPPAKQQRLPRARTPPKPHPPSIPQSPDAPAAGRPALAGKTAAARPPHRQFHIQLPPPPRSAPGPISPSARDRDTAPQ